MPPIENNGTQAPAPLNVALIPGDGVGPEVVAATAPLLVAAGALDGRDVRLTELDWGAGRWLREGSAKPDDAAAILRGFDAGLFGAVGRPDVPDDVSSWGLIISLRQELGLFANLRPVRHVPGIPSPVVGAEGTDMLIVRENSEGEYSGIGGRVAATPDAEVAVELAVHSRAAIERLGRYAFDQAEQRGGRLTLATKSNAFRHGFVLWDRVIRELAAEHPDVIVDYALVDALAARIIQRPGSVDVMLASNLFGDILSDLAAVLCGGLGMAPSANVRPGGDVPGLYEPVHGSAPDIAGRGIANPVGCILSAAMLLDDCGCPRGAAALRDAVTDALQDPAHRTRDIGGEATTDAVAVAIGDRLSGVTAA
ncbi:MAG: ttuC [Solirubrobacterales bacterium]|nr:ttuC [Solirubrobacterales bacterium]